MQYLQGKNESSSSSEVFGVYYMDMVDVCDALKLKL